MKRVLIVTYHSFISQAVRLALRQTAGLHVVGVADGRQTVRGHLVELKPDVVVVDDMQNREEALERLREAGDLVPKAKRLLLTVSMDQDWLEDVFATGTDAVISKTVHPVALGALLRETVRSNIVHRFSRARRADGDCPLTAREIEILGLAAQGHTNVRIARTLWVTEQTVKFHLSNTYRKLGVSNRTEASRYAYAHSLVAPAEPVAT